MAKKKEIFNIIYDMEESQIAYPTASGVIYGDKLKNAVIITPNYIPIKYGECTFIVHDVIIYIDKNIDYEMVRNSNKRDKDESLINEIYDFLPEGELFYKIKGKYNLYTILV